MNRNKFRANLPLYVALTLIALFILWFYFSLKPFSKKDFPNYEVKDSIPKEYLSLMKENDTAKIKFLISYFSPNRFPISLLNYKEKYTIIIHKLAENIFKPLDKNVMVLHRNSSVPTGVVYGVVNESMFEFLYAPQDSVQYKLPIRLNLSGDSVRVLQQTDSQVACYLRFGHISLNFGQTDRLYFYIAPKIDFPIAYKIPAFIYLVKKQGSLYFILFSVNTRTEMLDSDSVLHLFAF